MAVGGETDQTPTAASPDQQPEPRSGPQADDSVVLSAVESDPLLACLEFISAFHKRPYSAKVLVAGLPVGPEGMTPQIFLKAAERAGFRSKIVKRSFSRIPIDVYPVVVMLASGPVVLVRRTEDGRAIAFLPETGSVETGSLDELIENYTGYAAFVRPEVVLEDFEQSTRDDDKKHWFWGTIFKSKGLYLQVMLAAVVINMFAMTVPLFTMNVYDRVVPNNAIETLYVLAIGAGLVFVFDFILKTLRGLFIDLAGKRADVILACRIFDQLLDMKIASRPQSAGAFASTLKEFESVRDFFTSATLISFVDLPFALLFLLVIYFLAGPPVFVFIAAIGLVLVYALLVQIPLGRVVRRYYKENQQRHGILIETINGLEIIKSIGAEARMRYLWEGLVGLTAKSSQSSRAWSMSAQNFAALINQVSNVSVVIVGVHLLVEGEMTMGGIIATVMLGSRALGPFTQLSQLLVRLNQTRASLGGLNSMMQAEVERPPEKRFLHRPTLEGSVAFDHVSFTYPGREAPALRDISFNIKAGEHVGIIGRIGSGKSTVAKLVMGLYDSQDGMVTIGGTDLRQIDPVDLRREIGYVPQEPFLFRGTIRDNIAAAAPHVSDEKILNAARLTGVDELVRQSPLGYDTPVGERGDGLSGGQRQAVTLARAIVRDPAIVIMDEPTSSMDARTEDELFKGLKDSLKGRTLLLVTHRGSLLGLVDRLIVMDSGTVVADGPRQKVVEDLAKGRVRSSKSGAAK
ncbi:type I secretion system permease/ATPase [Magnetospira sp. QH-2]|uniref:type I secretion system permease/ATPase n=1 Tax=Magnetospira sp. (strain QH-2) TaxID=1288970 RepID=UPI0003E817C0|nr:type I secretion system permease/ATPase [Magnetospira sp. QH-2]CCQ75232.1 putative ABC transporter, ATPase and permease [Magnetospira sp. QH-2]